MILSAFCCILFLTTTVLFTLCMAPAFLVCMLAAGQRRPLFVRRFIYWYGCTILAVVLRPAAKVCVRNPDHVDVHGAFLVFNHRSASDPFLVAAVSDWKYPAIQIVNSWPMRLPFLGFFARFGHYVDVMNVDMDTVRSQVQEALRDNCPVAAFPEGTRSGSRSMNQFHSGVFHMAKDLNIPIVPVAIAGNEAIPDRDFRIHRGRIMMRVMKKITPEDMKNMSAYQLKEQVRSRLALETKTLDAELDGEKI